MKRIVLTGGGTAGHVTPNIALIPRLRELGYEIYYIGSYDGIEKKLYSGRDNFSAVYPFVPYQFNLLGDVLTPTQASRPVNSGGILISRTFRIRSGS